MLDPKINLQQLWGFNVINFNKNYIEVNPVTKLENIKKLEKVFF